MHCTTEELKNYIETLGNKVKDIEDTLNFLKIDIAGSSMRPLEKRGMYYSLDQMYKTIEEFCGLYKDIMKFELTDVVCKDKDNMEIME